MTQEEKAKAYDEVIKKAESLYKVAEPMSGCNVIIETLFPELTESEDERIRKELIRIVDIWTNSAPIVNGIPREKLLAYLEKQCKQKPADKVEPKFKVGDIIKPKDRGHEPWQIMQVDILDKKYRFKDGYVIHFSQEDNYELVEQKPAWSEEDESLRRRCIGAIDMANLSDYTKDNLLNWLKSLKDRL